MNGYFNDADTAKQIGTLTLTAAEWATLHDALGEVIYRDSMRARYLRPLHDKVYQTYYFTDLYEGYAADNG